LDANFRDTRERLAQAQKGLESESIETICARYYADGLAAMERSDLGGALAAFEKVRKLDAQYRDVANLLVQIEGILQQRNKAASTVAANMQVDFLYQEAVAAMENENWMQAAVALEKNSVVAAKLPRCHRPACGRTRTTERYRRLRRFGSAPGQRQYVYVR
jgi:outer membrane protein assembly factor BamD (BamD/ComL family)